MRNRPRFEAARQGRRRSRRHRSIGRDASADPARASAAATNPESRMPNRRRRLTTFAQRYLERRKGATMEHRFELTFRTLTVPQMTARLERAGFVVERILGDYRGQPWDARADVWIILATRRR